jgi:hypothetical protein
MKYIITEQQHKRLIESNDKLVPYIQKVIDKQLHRLWEICEEENDDDYDYMCEVQDMIEKITVDHIENIDDKENSVYLYLIFDYLSHTEPDFSDFYYSFIKTRLKELFGINFILRYKGNQLINPY